MPSLHIGYPIMPFEFKRVSKVEVEAFRDELLRHLQQYGLASDVGDPTLSAHGKSYALNVPYSRTANFADVERVVFETAATWMGGVSEFIRTPTSTGTMYKWSPAST